MNKPMRTSLSHAPNLKRYREIVSVLARHGFGSFLANLQLERHITLPPRLLKQEYNSHISPAKHLRLALEELGPTFVKLGQLGHRSRQPAANPGCGRVYCHAGLEHLAADFHSEGHFIDLKMSNSTNNLSSRNSWVSLCSIV